MAWVEPAFSKSQVSAAGRSLREGNLDPASETRALEVLNNWRASHSFPLNTLQVGLRDKARRVYEHALIAQRLKRTPSIVRKLTRFPKMQLARMQNIGGCRAVVLDVRQVRRLHELHRESRMKHKLVNEKDYISNPKDSGYRGAHLVYRYFSDRTDTYNGHLIEVQLRSRIQHAWATAVETVGTFLETSLKSSEGPTDWLRFFAFTGSAFAMAEGTELVPGVPADRGQLLGRVREMANELDVARRLQGYRTALQVFEDPDLRDSRYFLMVLRAEQGRLAVTGFSFRELTLATQEYLRAETEFADTAGAEVVLVASESVQSLRRAYPNYYLDTEVFLSEFAKVLRD